MEHSSQEAERLVRAGVDALRQGRSGEARQLFEKASQAWRGSAQVWLLLAVACGDTGDAAAEEAAVDQLIALEPRMIRGHIMKADCRAQAGDEGTALGFYKSAVLIASAQQVPGDLVPELRRAEAAAAEIEARIEVRREAALVTRGFPPESRSARFQHSLDILAGRRRIYVQEPTGYYFPELPQIQFYDTKAFDWVPAVEAAADAIREEIAAVLAEGMDGFKPYLRRDSERPRVDDNHLLDSSDWSALFLCENGTMFDDVIERCPKTWEVVEATPLPRMANSPTIMFSLLRAGARIAPHTGTHNARLICHLPLIVPPDCGFRVGNDVRQWEVGKLLIFDDTIEHEAWNNSPEDRVVLIFDIWRPELDERERQEVGALFLGPARE